MVACKGDEGRKMVNVGDVPLESVQTPHAAAENYLEPTISICSKQMIGITWKTELKSIKKQIASAYLAGC